MFWELFEELFDNGQGIMIHLLRAEAFAQYLKAEF